MTLDHSPKSPDNSTASDLNPLAQAQCQQDYRTGPPDTGWSCTLPRPLIVHSRADIAAHLANLRRARGETCEQQDNRMGWSDRYTAKMEHGDTPSGRQGFHISAMAEVWLQGHDLSLVLMTTAQAEAIGAVEAPRREAKG